MTVINTTCVTLVNILFDAVIIGYIYDILVRRKQYIGYKTT